MERHTLKVDSVQIDFGDRRILRDVYLECKQGEIIGLLGRNGSGKSTLLKIIFGSLTPLFKHISIDGEVLDKGFYKSRICYLPQHPYLPKYALVSTLAKTMIADEFWDEFTAMPIYQSHQHKKCGALSGGERRQLEMLLVLFSRATFVLLDEPFTHVTPAQSDVFKQLLRHVAQVKGIIITDHQYQNILDISDKIILMDNGISRHINHPDELVRYAYLSG